MREVSLTEKILAAAGMTDDPSWAEGSGSCVAMRRKTLESLPAEAQKHGLTLTQSWQRMLACANIADDLNGGNETLRNTSRISIAAIHDAIARKEGKPGTEPTDALIDLRHGGLRADYVERTKNLASPKA